MLCSLWAAVDTTGREGRLVRALPREKVLELYRGRGRYAAVQGQLESRPDAVHLLPEPVDPEAAALPNALHLVEVEHGRHDLLADARLVAHRPFRIDHQAAAVADRRRRVDVHHGDLVDDRVRARDHRLGVAIGRAGQRDLEDRLGALPRERAEDLGERAVVADGEPEAADALDVEADGLCARLGRLVRLPGKALAVARDELPRRREDDGRVRGGVADPLVDAARHEPERRLAGERAQPLGQLARARPPRGRAVRRRPPRGAAAAP